MDVLCIVRGGFWAFGRGFLAVYISRIIIVRGGFWGSSIGGIFFTGRSFGHQQAVFALQQGIFGLQGWIFGLQQEI